LDATAAALLAAAKAPSPHTLASYERRWRMWEAFGLHHGVPILPAEPGHVASFVVARWRAGVSYAALAANLSAVLWFHRELSEDLADSCDLAKRVLGALRRETDPVPLVQAPVLSVGALVAMSQVQPWGTRVFSTKVLRLFTGAPSRQLEALRTTDVTFGPDDAWAEVAAPEVPVTGRHPAVPARRFRFDRGLTALDCPVRAAWALVETAREDGLLFPTKTTLYKASIKGFSPALSSDGVPVRIAVRNRAVLLAGYHGALRVEELARARVEHLDPAAGSYRLRLPESKTARGRGSEAVLLATEAGPLDPVAALDEWLAVRGDHDGPLFCTLHHGRAGSAAGGEAITADEIRDLIRDLAGAVGLPGLVSGYSLRRSWATHQYLRDPCRLPVISAHLRHSSYDMTARYIDDLGLHLLDAGELLSTELVLAGPGGVTEWRRDLGFDQASLAELLDEVDRLGDESGRFAPTTKRTHDSHWNRWEAWATEHGFDALPAEPERLVLFAADRARAGIAAQSLRAQLRTIRRLHEEAGYDGTDLITLADEIALGLARLSPAERNKAPVLSVDELRAMAYAARRQGEQGDVSAFQDLVVLCVGYAGALRMDDLYRARVENLDRLGYGYGLRFGASKENQTGRRAESVLLLTRGDDLDPVAAIDTWRALSPAIDGPLIPVIGSHPPVAMSKDSLPDRLRRLALDAGVITHPTGHSLRRSWATHAYERGVDPVTLSRHLRHRDLTTTLGYIAKLSAWVDNPAQQLITNLLLDADKQPEKQGR
jgi:integrase